MNKIEYANEVAQELKEQFPGRNIKVKEIEKSGTTLTGIMIETPEMNLEGAAGISPNFYIDTYFDRGLDPVDAAEKIADHVNELLKTGPGIDIGITKIPDLKNFEAIRDKVFPVLVSTANPEYLKDKAYRPFEDLAITYKIVLSPESSIRITTAMLEAMKITEEALYKAAVENLAKEPVRPKSMAETLSEMIGEAVAKEAGLVQEPDDHMPYVLSNNIKIHGASELLNTKVLDDFAAEHGWKNVVILPSSIHEVLLMKDEGNYDALLDMVRDVNRTQVAPEDRLSDNVYLYDSESGRLQALFDEHGDRAADHSEQDEPEPDR